MMTETVILILSLAANAALLWLFREPLIAMLRRRDAAAQLQAARDDIAEAISAGHTGGAVEKDDRDRLLAALDLAQRTVEDVMVHRSRMEMLDADTEPNLLISRVLASPHTRLPLFRDTPENIVGVIHGKDLLRAVERFRREGDGVLDSVSDLDILSVAMKPYFVPETTPLDEQMRQFLKRRTHFALVVDEYGSLRGLITLEDILEEIVGDITDEFDVVDKQPRLTPTDTGDYVVDGAIPIRDLNRMMEWQLPDDEAITLAGLVIHEAQAIPNAGQCFSFHGFRIEVLEKRDNRLTRLKLRPMQG